MNYLTLTSQSFPVGWYFPGFTSIDILIQIQKDLNARQMNPEQVEGRVIYMSMFNGIDWTNNGNSDVCIWNSEQVSDYSKKFQRGHWSFFGLEEE